VDELLYSSVMAHSLHAVVHVGAGLDTRPFRLHLPGDLHYIELDRGAVVLYKGLRLAHLAPRCRLDRVAVDVLDPATRRSAIFRACRGMARGLLLIENTLGQFSDEALVATAKRLPHGVKWWLFAVRPASFRAGQGRASGLVSQICGSRWEIAECRLLNREAHRLALDRPVATKWSEAWDAGSIWLLRRKAYRARGVRGVTLEMPERGVPLSRVGLG
jgi:hypothetical protein